MDGTIRGSAGGFQQMTQDALTVLNDIPFSIPPYFALLGKRRPIDMHILMTEQSSLGIVPDDAFFDQVVPSSPSRALLSQETQTTASSWSRTRSSLGSC